MIHAPASDGTSFHTAIPQVSSRNPSSTKYPKCFTFESHLLFMSPPNLQGPSLCLRSKEQIVYVEMSLFRKRLTSLELDTYKRVVTGYASFVVVHTVPVTEGQYVSLPSWCLHPYIDCLRSSLI